MTEQEFFTKLGEQEMIIARLRGDVKHLERLLGKYQKMHSDIVIAITDKNNGDDNGVSYSGRASMLLPKGSGVRD
jgi:hypothetical protein